MLDRQETWMWAFECALSNLSRFHSSESAQTLITEAGYDADDILKQLEKRFPVRDVSLSEEEINELWIKKNLGDYMRLLSTEKCNCTLGEWMELSEKSLVPGMLIHFSDNTSILVGDCMPSIKPTTCDGGIGWLWNEGHCLKKIKCIEYYSARNHSSKKPSENKKTATKYCELCGINCSIGICNACREGSQPY